jgi:hypothetical protein
MAKGFLCSLQLIWSNNGERVSMFTAINLVKLWQKGFYVHLNVSSQPTLKEPTSGYCRCREFNVTLTSETILALLQLVFDLWR